MVRTYAPYHSMCVEVWSLCSIYHMGARAQTQTVRLGGRWVDPLSHLTDPH